MDLNFNLIIFLNVLCWFVFSLVTLVDVTEHMICLNLLENVQSQNGENGIKEKALVQNFFLNQCFFFFFFFL